MLNKLIWISILKGFFACGALSFYWLIAAKLTAADAGLLFSVLSIAQGMAISLSFGIDQTIMRKGALVYANDGLSALSNLASQTAKFILKRSLVLIFTSLFIVILTHLIIKNATNLSTLILLSALLAPFIAVLPSSANIMRLKSNLSLATLSETSAVFSFATLLFYVVALFSPVSFEISYAITMLCFVTSGYNLFKHIQVKKELRVVHDRHFGITQIAHYAIQWGTIAQLSFYVDPEKIAIIALALRLVTAVTFVRMVASFINDAKISLYLQSENFDQLTRIIIKQSRFVGTAALIIMVIVFTISTDIFYYLGSDFNIAPTITKILIIGQFANVIAGPSSTLLNMSGNGFITSRITLAIGLPTIFLVYPSFFFGGLTGVAILISFSCLMLNLITMHFAYKLTKVRSFKLG